MSYVIRDAVPGDLPAILDIYNDAVLNTLAIWTANRSTPNTALMNSRNSSTTPTARP